MTTRTPYPATSPPLSLTPRIVSGQHGFAWFALYVFVGLALISGALQRPIGGDTLVGYYNVASVREANVRFQLVGAAFYALTFGIALLAYRPKRLPILAIPLLVLAALAALSCFWSNDWVSTASRSVGLIGCSLFALLSVEALGVERTLRVLVLFAVAFILTNAALSAAFPAYTHHGTGEIFRMHAGALKGTYSHKNSFARVLAVAVLVVVLLGRRHLGRTVAYVTVAIGIVLLFETHSAKTYISLPIAVGAAYLLVYCKRPSTRVLVAAGLALSAAIAMLALGEQISSAMLGAVGRDPTLSSRTVIWDAAIRAGMQHPLLGGGYEAAWKDGIGAAVRVALGFDSGHAHNGFIQTFLELGLIGLSIALGALAWMCASVLLLPSIMRQGELRLAIAWLLIFLINNAAGAYMMQPSDLYWFLLVITPFLIEHASSTQTMRIPNKVRVGSSA